MRLPLAFLTFIFCVQYIHAQDKYTPRYLAILDPSQGRELIHQCSRSSPDAKAFWTIDAIGQKLLQSKFKRLFVKLTRQCCGVGDHFSKASFQDYCFQCVGVVIHKKRFIYINALYVDADKGIDEFENWKTKPIVICDGGLYYWGILLNVRAKCFSQFDYNGP